jgi:cytochrome c oxidase subunit 1
VIGRRFLLTGLVFLVVGGLLALAMRWRLAWPNTPVPFLGDVDAAEYNALFTAHGTIMVFFVVVPLLVGAIGTFVVPLQIGAANTAWPSLARLSFWLYPAAGAVLLSGFAVEGGGAAAGWTSRPALSALAGPGQVSRRS